MTKYGWLACFFLCLLHANAGIAVDTKQSKDLLFKPIKSKNEAKVEESAVIWTRMRKQFSFHVPHDHQRVKYYLKQYAKNPYYINELVNNSYPYLHYIVEELEKRGLPAELALLPMVESTFDPNARSQSGAVGLWQIMPGTGKYFGLEQDTHFEGCRDICGSTEAALKHLEYLNKRFKGDWFLALAAYNLGEGKVMRAMKKNRLNHKKTDFWSLNLPKETTDYIPKLLALAEIVKHPSKYGVKIPNIPNKPYFTKIENSKPIELNKLACELDISAHELHRLNPGHVAQIIHPNSPKDILVPTHVATQAKTCLKDLPAFKPAKQHSIVVKKGDTLSKIAAEHGTTTQALQKHNKLTSTTIKVGMRLEIPNDKIVVAKTPPKPATKKPTVHVVKYGDSLWRISKQYNVSIQKIAAKNNLTVKSQLKPGQKLVIEV